MWTRRRRRFLTEAEMLQQESRWFAPSPDVQCLTEPEAGSPPKVDIGAIRKELYDNDRSALCLSGGGIRSSSFCLGVMQELARHGCLSDFDYLSTVSGGGFVGSWLSSRLHSGENYGSADEIMRASETESGMRSRARYLAMDNRQVWDLAATFLRNMMCNWLALVPLILALMALTVSITASGRQLILAGLGGLFLVGTLLSALAGVGTVVATLAKLGSWCSQVGLKGFLIVGIGFALSSRDLNVLLARLTYPMLVVAGLLVVVSVTVLLRLYRSETRSPAWLIAMALLVHLSSFVLGSWVVRHSASDVSHFVRGWTLKLGVPADFMATVADVLPAVLRTNLSQDLILSCIVFGIIGLVFSAVNPNSISLNGIFSQRIGSAFVVKGNSAPMVSPSTVVTSSGTIRLEGTSRRGLFHVINSTANDPIATGATQAERRGCSFVFTPLHCGLVTGSDTTTASASIQDGAPFETKHLGQYRIRSNTLPMAKALAISGAAVSPQMGSYGSSLLAFPLTLLNIRLGFWLRWSQPILPEFLTGMTSNIFARIFEAIPPLMGFSRQVGNIYLTDGGHFDNLGLYEMIRRHCRNIVVLDGGRDPRGNLKSLANVIRRVQTDFGVHIVMDNMMRNAAIYRGTIHYGPSDAAKKCGTIIYIRPHVSQDDPADVTSYARANPDFPNESTADQSFSESQFESYRNLGKSILKTALLQYENWKGATAIPTAPEGDGDKVRRLVQVLSEVSSEATRGIKIPDRAGGIIYRLHKHDKVQVLVSESIDKQTAVLPKGCVEIGERLQETASRELCEETGYSFDIPDDCEVIMSTFDRDGATRHVAYYLLRFSAGKLLRSRSGRESRRLFWLTVPDSDKSTPKLLPMTATDSADGTKGHVRHDEATKELGRPVPKVPEDIVKLLREHLDLIKWCDAPDTEARTNVDG